MVYKYYKSQGSGRWLGLSKITGQAKICLRPSTLPGLAWLFLAWPGLAWLLASGRSRHITISDSGFRTRKSGPEIPKSRDSALRFRGPEVRPRNPGLGNAQLGNVQLKICNL